MTRKQNSNKVSSKSLESAKASAAADMGDIFGAISNRKTSATTTTASSSTSVGAQHGGEGGAGESCSHSSGGKSKIKPHSSSSSGGGKEAPASSAPKRDGLYHAPDPNRIANMKDDDFFLPSASSSKGRKRERELAALKKERQARGAGRDGGGDNDDDDDDDDAEWGYDRAKVARKEGVDRIITMRELKGMLSGKNSRAGTTPNCPFDCDCCF